MTFKHVKFQDSVVMRSLEKVAREKGLVKEEDLVKTAAKKTDLTPTTNLLVNLLKLSEGLRQSGFDKQAGDLEKKILAYKQAQTLYETSKEKGEDLVDAAHPKGSHKLEGVDGDDAVIETIIDQQLKSVEMIAKMPTGKLASSVDVLRAVKKALAQDVNEVRTLVNQAASTLDSVASLVNQELTFSIDSSIAKAREYVSNPTVYNIQEFKTLVTRLSKRLNPSAIQGSTWGLGGVSDYTWNRVQPLLNKAQEFLNQAIELRKKVDSGEQASLEGKQPPSGVHTLPEVTIVGDPNSIDTRVANSLSKINSYKSQISADLELTEQQKAAVAKWLDGRATLYNNQLDNYKSVPEEEKAGAYNRLSGNLNKLDAQLKTFYDKWLA